MKIVEVIWDDAHCTTSATTIKRAGKVKPIRTHTVAYLVAENEAGIVLGTDAYEKQPKEFRMINFIPWGMVVAYYEIVV